MVAAPHAAPKRKMAVAAMTSQYDCDARKGLPKATPNNSLKNRLTCFA
jgi:hypothetical protein